MLTRDDLENIKGLMRELIVDMQLVTRKDLRNEIRTTFSKYDKKMTRKLNLIIRSFDERVDDHEIRLRMLERQERMKN